MRFEHYPVNQVRIHHVSYMCNGLTTPRSSSPSAHPSPSLGWVQPLQWVQQATCGARGNRAPKVASSSGRFDITGPVQPRHSSRQLKHPFQPQESPFVNTMRFLYHTESNLFSDATLSEAGEPLGTGDGPATLVTSSPGGWIGSLRLPSSPCILLLGKGQQPSNQCFSKPRGCPSLQPLLRGPAADQR